MEAALVTVSTGAIKPLLSKLFKLLGEEHAKLKGVRRDANFIGDEMRSMQAALETLADEEQLDPELRIWRDAVRELSYDMEDCVDDFVARVDQDLDGRTFLKKLVDTLKKPKYRRQIAEEMEKLKTRATEASERHKRYNVVRPTPDISTCAIDPRLPALYVEVDELIGIDGPKDDIIDWFQWEGTSAQLQVLSIVGSGGLGKTTLANQVYHAIRSQFSCDRDRSGNRHRSREGEHGRAGEPIVAEPLLGVGRRHGALTVATLPVDARPVLQHAFPPADGAFTDVESSDEDELALARHSRPTTRHASPRSGRRASRDALTPPTTPTSVLPSSSSSSKAPAARYLAPSSPAMPALMLCAPDRLQQPLPTMSSSPSRPPGFDNSPVLTATPPFVSASPPRRTPERPRVAAATPPAVDPLFVPCTRPLLPSPASSPPLRPTNRRKTLAGVAMTRTGAYSLRRITDQKKAKGKVAPIAGAAEAMVCRGLGIISDGQVVTAAALEEFYDLFKDKVESEVMQAIRKLFKVDTPADEAIDDALIGHGGAQGLDVEAETDAAAVSDV